VTAGACLPVTVERRDAFDNPVNTASSLNVALTTSAASGTTFYSDGACTTTATQVTIAATTSAIGFSIKATLANAAAQTITGTGGSLTNATLALTVNADVASKLVFSPATGNMTAGTCTPSVTVTRQDAFNNPTTLGGALQVNLSSNATSNFTFYTSSGNCAAQTTAVTSVTIANATASTNFFMRAQVAESVTVTGAPAAGTLTNASGTYTVGPAAVNKLVFSPTSQTLTAGVCSAATTVERRDVYDNPISTGAALLTVGLTSNATTGLAFYTTSNCTGGAVTSVDIPANGSTSPTFYIRATKVEPVTVNGTGGGLIQAVQTLTINPGPAYQTAFTSTALTLGVGTCSTAITVQQQDQFGNPVNATGSTTVALTDNGTNFDFHLVAGCGDAAQTNATIAAGQSTVTFYVQGTTAGVVQMTATISGLTVAGQQNITLGSNHLAFTTAAQSNVPAGTCSGIITVQRQDPANNPINSGGSLTVTLSSNATSNATGGLAFYTDSACTTLATSSQVTISGGQTQVSFYVKANVAPESSTLTASASGFSPNATQAYSTAVGPAAKLHFFSPGPQTIAALNCSALVTVRLEDLGGNAVNAGSTRAIVFSSTSPPNVTFFTNSGCTTAMASNTVNMASGASTVTGYFKADNAGTPTLTAATTSITSGTEQETITAADPVKLTFNPAPPATVEAGFCQPLTLERQDALNRATAPSTATAVTNITVSAPQGGTGGTLTTQLFSDSTCTTLLAFPTSIPASSSSTVIYAKGRSGDVSGTATIAHAYTITPVSALATNTATTLNVNPMVRRGSCTLGAAATSVTCAVSPNLAEITRTFLVYQASSDNDTNPSAVTATCKLQINGSSVAEVVCERGIAVGQAINVNWQTVSFAYNAANGGVTVQHVSTAVNNGLNSASQNIGITSSTSAQSFLLWSYRDGSNFARAPDAREMVMAELTSDTNVRMSIASDGQYSGQSGGNWETQVVNWSGASVARGTTAGGSAQSYNVAQSTPNLSRSVLLYSSRMATIAETGAPEFCARRLTGDITSTSQLTFARGSGCTLTSHDIGDISWERVELPTNVTVQHLNVQINNNNSGNKAITQVDRTRAFVFSGGQLAGGTANGSTNYTGADGFACTQANATFASEANVLLTRLFNCGNQSLGGTSTSTWNVNVVEVTP
jgi:hypothetical protein